MVYIAFIKGIPNNILVDDINVIINSKPFLPPT